MAALTTLAPMAFCAQQSTAAQRAKLPDSPAIHATADTASPIPSPAVPAADATQNTATIAGTVLDASGAEVQGADVVLRSSAGAKVGERHTGSDGEFQFAGLAAGSFRLTADGPGLGTIRRTITLRPGGFRIVSRLRLPMLGTTSTVRVFGDPVEISVQQMHIAEHQRVLGVFPNFYSTYDWNAPPMMAKQKFQLALRSLVDPVTFFTVGAVAGAEQYKNIFPGYGQGVQGYAKRYGAAYADDVAGRILGNALLPAVFHQDPRYFYKGTGSLHSRFFYALAAAVIARGDNGHWEPNYSHVLGSFAAGGISNLYYPASSRGASLMAVNGAIGIASNAGENVLREFVLKRFTTRGSDRKNP
ncbi:MAG TPA: carboxypeptidase-like regulatory domain-containing protein [Terracidiphilus sp.]|nr:carboxypeptidase-like regulatory domain-containing protein [Terracidiphilus sp.]